MAQEFKVNFLQHGTTFAYVAVPQSACPKWNDASVKAAKRARGACGIIEVGDAPSLVLPGRTA